MIYLTMLLFIHNNKKVAPERLKPIRFYLKYSGNRKKKFFLAVINIFCLVELRYRLIQVIKSESLNYRPLFQLPKTSLESWIPSFVFWVICGFTNTLDNGDAASVNLKNYYQEVKMAIQVNFRDARFEIPLDL
ncbi:hypothetical protein ABEB36_002961 [Hypothenemus hampei]|uniref:Uncharacterized protein n=1 Tax=Hypothenemus hampei TaxID=57062 RepID=A0ABD1F7K0_HYPHA